MLERVSFVTLFAAASLLGCSTGDERPGSTLELVVIPPTATTQALSPATMSVPVAVATTTANASAAAPSSSAVPASSASASGAAANGSGMGTSAPPVSTAPVVPCTDTVPDDRETCQTWKDWGECESGWLKDPGFCNATCERCPTTTPTGTTPNPMGSTPDPSGTSNPPPAGSSGMGNDNPYMPITSGGEGFATRYWDCSKQSCGWSGNAGGNAVKSCNKEGGSLGVTEERNGFDGGNAFTCFSFAPWAHSTEVAYGFAATHVSNTCGKCYQLQFTGAGNSSPNDPGSQALKGKTMVVMAANIGGDVGGNQLDILIPGGGVGAVNACGKQGLPPMGAQYGGFLTECSGDLNAKKECVRQKCDSAFADAKYADLKKGCAWFVDWFQAADNPRYLSKEIPCPQELNSAAR